MYYKIGMRKLIGLFAIIAVFVSGCGLFGGGETGGGGELTGITNRPPWDQPTPYGMVVIPAGSFHMGNNDQDINVSNVALNRQITVSAFYMDDTEITNNEYRQFLETAKDTLPAEMAALVYPDTMVWINDFAFAYNEPYTEAYFWHPAFDEYPVVGVNWYAASYFCQWRTAHYNNFRLEVGLLPIPRFRLPTEAEWEYASRGGYEHTLYPWESPYIKNAAGCFLANFKPGRGDYIADNFDYTCPVLSYWPNDYNLWCMPGNVAEWCEDDFEESGYTYAHDLNPVFYDVIKFGPSDVRSYNYDNPMRQPGGAKIRKVIRGGSWKDIGYFLSCGSRTYEYVDSTKSFIGFRCVSTQIARDGSNL